MGGLPNHLALPAVLVDGGKVGIPLDQTVQVAPGTLTPACPVRDQDLYGLGEGCPRPLTGPQPRCQLDPALLLRCVLQQALDYCGRGLIRPHSHGLLKGVTKSTARTMVVWVPKTCPKRSAFPSRQIQDEAYGRQQP